MRASRRDTSIDPPAVLAVSLPLRTGSYVPITSVITARSGTGEIGPSRDVSADLLRRSARERRALQEWLTPYTLSRVAHEVTGEPANPFRAADDLRVSGLGPRRRHDETELSRGRRPCARFAGLPGSPRPRAGNLSEPAMATPLASRRRLAGVVCGDGRPDSMRAHAGARAVIEEPVNRSAICCPDE